MERSELNELQAVYIQRMLDNAEFLRRKAKVTEAELAASIGMHRQSYCNMIVGRTALSWRNYLALVFYFDHNQRTHALLHKLNIYPEQYVAWINNIEEERESQ